MLRRLWSNRNSHSWLVAMQNGTATLEGSLVLSYKTKNTLTVYSSNHAPWYYPKELKTYVYTKTCTPVYRCFIRNCQNLEIIKMSFSRWVDEQTVLLPENGILLSAKKKWLMKLWKRHGKILNAYHEVKEVNLKGCILYDSSYMTFLKRQDYGDNKKLSDCWELVGSERW